LVAGSIRDEVEDKARATLTPEMVSGEVPNAFDIRSRTRGPPMLVRMSCRSVRSCVVVGWSAACGSTWICALAHEPTQK
jgi:hypothetical protein